MRKNLCTEIEILGVIFVTRIQGVFPDENSFAYDNFCRRHFEMTVNISSRKDSHISSQNYPQVTLGGRSLPIEFGQEFNRQEPSHAKGVPNDSLLSKYHFEAIVIDSFERTVNLPIVIFKGQLIEKRLSEIDL